MDILLNEDQITEVEVTLCPQKIHASILIDNKSDNDLKKHVRDLLRQAQDPYADNTQLSVSSIRVDFEDPERLFWNQHWNNFLQKIAIPQEGDLTYLVKNPPEIAVALVENSVSNSYLENLLALQFKIEPTLGQLLIIDYSTDNSPFLNRELYGYKVEELLIRAGAYHHVLKPDICNNPPLLRNYIRSCAIEVWNTRNALIELYKNSVTEELAPTNEEIFFEDISLYPQALKLFSHLTKEQIDLTEREAEIMKVLLERTFKYISKEEIVNILLYRPINTPVTRNEIEENSGNLRTSISRLSSKVFRPHLTSLIFNTVRKSKESRGGYSIELRKDENDNHNNE